MASQIKNFNVVLVGQNFPVGSVRLDEFKFRGRHFQETLRIGPTAQGVAGTAAIHMLPDRFQVSLMQVDRLEIQLEGIREVVSSFVEMVGRRTIQHVGQNAVVVFNDSTTYERAISHIFRQDRIKDLISPADDFRSGATFEFARDAHSRIRLLLGRSEEDELALDFNIDFDVSHPEFSVLDAMGQMDTSLAYVSEISASFGAAIEGAGASI